MARLDCPLCRAALTAGATRCPRCGARVAALERRPRGRGASPAGPLLPGAPRTLAEAVRLGLAGGAALVAAAMLAALLTRVAGGDGIAALGNAALLLGMAALGLSALLGGVRVSRWADVGRGGEDRLRRRARFGAGEARGRARISLAVAGALPFVLFVVLAVTHAH